MAVRKLKPVTPGQRHKIIGTFEDITEYCYKNQLHRPLSE